MHKLPKSLTTITTFSKLIALFIFITFPILGFFLGMQYQSSINTYNTKVPTMNISPTKTTYISPTTTNQNDAKLTNISFQQLLKDQCKIIGAHEKYPNIKTYAIDLSQLPFTLSSSVRTKYSIQQNIVCNLNLDSPEELKGDTAFISAKSTQDNLTASILIGDKNSINMGMKTPQLDYNSQYEAYYKPSNRQPFTISNNEGLKTIVDFIPPEPYCPREDSGFILEFLTYKELGIYKLLVSRIYTFPLDSEMQSMFIKYAEKVDKTKESYNPDNGDYESCRNLQFSNDFFNRYFPSYATTDPRFKSILDENIEDINEITLK